MLHSQSQLNLSNSISTFLLKELGKSKILKILVLIFFLVAGRFLARADNGAIAIAYPSTVISIDGKLNDWPEYKFPILKIK